MCFAGYIIGYCILLFKPIYGLLHDPLRSSGHVASNDGMIMSNEVETCKKAVLAWRKSQPQSLEGLKNITRKNLGLPVSRTTLRLEKSRMWSRSVVDVAAAFQCCCYVPCDLSNICLLRRAPQDKCQHFAETVCNLHVKVKIIKLFHFSFLLSIITALSKLQSLQSHLL